MYLFGDESAMDHTPLATHRSEGVLANGWIEETFVYEVHSTREYYLMVYYQGELTSTCDYYNAMLSYSSVDRLNKELTCLSDEQIAQHNREGRNT